MKKTISSALAIILVFVFAFMAVASGRTNNDDSKKIELPFGLGELFGKKEEADSQTEFETESTTDDVYGFSDNLETYTNDTEVYTEPTQTSTTTRPTTTRIVTTTTRPTTTRRVTTTTRPTTTQRATTTTTGRVTTTEPSSNVSLNSRNVSAVVDFYNDAVRATYSTGAPAVYQTMQLRGNITGSGGIAPYLSELEDILEIETEAFSGTSYGIPGEDDIEAVTVSTATATSTGGKTRVHIVFKDFSVSLGDLDKVDPGEMPEEFNDIFAEFGTSVVSGRDTVKLTLSNNYIDCTVDERTGKIIDGTWNYDVDFVFGNAEMNLSGTTLSLVDFCIPMRLRVTL